MHLAILAFSVHFPNLFVCLFVRGAMDWSRGPALVSRSKRLKGTTGRTGGERQRVHELRAVGVLFIY